jgi:hypothetical protein
LEIFQICAEKAKVRIFGDQQFQRESRFVHAINMPEYMSNTARIAVSHGPMRASKWLMRSLKTATKGLKVGGSAHNFKPRHIARLKMLLLTARCVTYGRNTAVLVPARPQLSRYHVVKTGAHNAQGQNTQDEARQRGTRCVNRPMA